MYCPQRGAASRAGENASLIKGAILGGAIPDPPSVGNAAGGFLFHDKERVL